MNSKNMVKSFFIGTVAIFSNFAMTVSAYAATQGAEQQQKVSSGDDSLQYLQIVKDWLAANGAGILVAVGVLVIGRWLAKWITALSRKAMTRGGVDETLSRFLGKLIYYGLLAAVAIAAADQVGIKTTSFLAILGAAGLAIGLALKDSLSNFASRMARGDRKTRAWLGSRLTTSSSRCETTGTACAAVVNLGWDLPVSWLRLEQLRQKRRHAPLPTTLRRLRFGRGFASWKPRACR